jgi:hypothetical protein
MKQRHIRLISYHFFNGKIKYLKHRIIIMANEVKEFFSTYSDFVTKVTSDPSLRNGSIKSKPG